MESWLSVDMKAMISSCFTPKDTATLSVWRHKTTKSNSNHFHPMIERPGPTTLTYYVQQCFCANKKKKYFTATYIESEMECMKMF